MEIPMDFGFECHTDGSHQRSLFALYHLISYSMYILYTLMAQLTVLSIANDNKTSTLLHYFLWASRFQYSYSHSTTYARNQLTSLAKRQENCYSFFSPCFFFFMCCLAVPLFCYCCCSLQTSSIFVVVVCSFRFFFFFFFFCSPLLLFYSQLHIVHLSKCVDYGFYEVNLMCLCVCVCLIG